MLIDSMKVVSFCHVLQGPAATQYLGDMGADIVKIEPLTGERARSWAGQNIYPGGVSGFYLCAARNKRVLAVDLKSPEGQEIVMSLIEKADVVLENFRSGVMARLGLSFEQVKKRKPDIIYASGTGWGRVGPMISRESQDLIIQARTGLIHATGTHRSTPVGGAIIDQHGGALLAMAVLGAYIRKLTTGKGTHVESSLFGAGLDLQTEPLTAYMSAPTAPAEAVFKRNPNLATWYHEAPYGVYKLLDAEIAISSNDPKNVADALDSEELREMARPNMFEIRNEYAEKLAEILAGRKYSDVEKSFDANKIWYSRVFNYDDVASDPQVEAADVFRKIKVNGADAVLVNHPVKYDGQTPPLRHLATKIGEDTADILSELGFTQAEIESLAARNVVAIPEVEGKTTA